MKTKKRFLSILLSLVLILGLMPGMSLTAYADGTTYNPASTYTGFGDFISSDTEVTISEVSGITWYVIANDSSTVTLLSKQSFDNKAFNSSGTGNDYATSDIKSYVDGLTGAGQPLAEISSVISDLTLIDITTAQGLSETKRKGAGVDWWLRSPGTSAMSISAAFVYGGFGSVSDYGRKVDGSDTGGPLGVRPALKLDLSKVTFDSTSKTFSLPTPYPLWVGGTQVTSANASNIDGNNKMSYDDATKILTLNNFSYSGSDGKSTPNYRKAYIYATEELNSVCSAIKKP